MKKFPKQWKHWCKVVGLKSPYKPRQKDSWKYALVGHGFVFRVNGNGVFEIGDPIQEFDRWATAITFSIELKDITSEKKFKDAVKLLVWLRKHIHLDKEGWDEYGFYSPTDNYVTVATKITGVYCREIAKEDVIYGGDYYTLSLKEK